MSAVSQKSPFGSPCVSPRNRMANGDRSWIDVQRNTFTNWTNVVLQKRHESIKSLELDLSDGFMLKCMYEVLTDKDFGRFKKAKMRISKVENLSRVLQKFSSDGLRLVNIGAEDICDGNPKIILGLIWSLITKYQIMAMRGGHASPVKGRSKQADGERSPQKSPISPKKVLLRWLNVQLVDYPTEVKDFRQSWVDGHALCDLVDSFAPDQLLPEDTRADSALSRIEEAMAVAEERLGVPRVLESEHLLSGADDLSTMTYISYFQKAELLPERPPTPEPEPILEKPDHGLVDADNFEESQLTEENLLNEEFLASEKTHQDRLDGADVKGTSALTSASSADSSRSKKKKKSASIDTRSSKKDGKKKASVMLCHNCERVLPERNFKLFQRRKGALRQCVRCVRREPVFTEPKWARAKN